LFVVVTNFWTGKLLRAGRQRSLCVTIRSPQWERGLPVRIFSLAAISGQDARAPSLFVVVTNFWTGKLLRAGRQRSLCVTIRSPQWERGLPVPVLSLAAISGQDARAPSLFVVVTNFWPGKLLRAGRQRS